MELEYLLAWHRRLLENLKILKTVKYSGLVGIIVATISKGLIGPEMELSYLLLIIALGFVLFVFFDSSIDPLERLLWSIENAIRNLKITKQAEN
ncbi:MAG: hypothetical protein KKH88_01630 [Nanoarchaeota archaeon]|nr:hypothetical protein [Nanoarchaeota archaeon]